MEYKDYFGQLTAAVNLNLGLKIQSLPKCPFLTVFSKTYRPTKVDVLGPWEAGILFRNLWRFFFCFIPGYPKLTPYVPRMASKLTSSYLSRCFYKCTCHLAAASQSFSEVGLV